jgi:hypothetical protein
MIVYGRLNHVEVSGGVIVPERVERSASGIEAHSIAHYIVIAQAGDCAAG